MDGNGNDGGSACQTRADRPPVVAGALDKGGNDGMTPEGRVLMRRYSPVIVALCITSIPSRMTAVCRGRDRWRKIDLSSAIVSSSVIQRPATACMHDHPGAGMISGRPATLCVAACLVRLGWCITAKEP